MCEADKVVICITHQILDVGLMTKNCDYRYAASLAGYRLVSEVASYYFGGLI